MDIKREVTVGYTTDANAMVTVKPNDGNGIEIVYKDVSGVIPQFVRKRTKQVEDYINSICEENGVKDAYFYIEDAASLDCTIKHFISDALAKATAEEQRRFN